MSNTHRMYQTGQLAADPRPTHAPPPLEALSAVANDMPNTGDSRGTTNSSYWLCGASPGRIVPAFFSFFSCAPPTLSTMLPAKSTTTTSAAQRDSAESLHSPHALAQKTSALYLQPPSLSSSAAGHSAAAVLQHCAAGRSAAALPHSAAGWLVSLPVAASGVPAPAVPASPGTSGSCPPARTPSRSPVLRAQPRRVNRSTTAWRGAAPNEMLLSVESCRRWVLQPCVHGCVRTLSDFRSELLDLHVGPAVLILVHRCLVLRGAVEQVCRRPLLCLPLEQVLLHRVRDRCPA